MAMRVVMTPEAENEFRKLPATIKARVLKVLERLQHWPDVSGAKPLRGDMHGLYRVRTGDWRVIFEVKKDVIVIRIANRRDVYDD